MPPSSPDLDAVFFSMFCCTASSTFPKPLLGPTWVQSWAKVTSKVTPNDVQSDIPNLIFRKSCNLVFCRLLYEFDTFLLSGLDPDLLKNNKKTPTNGACTKSRKKSSNNAQQLQKVSISVPTGVRGGAASKSLFRVFVDPWPLLGPRWSPNSSQRPLGTAFVTILLASASQNVVLWSNSYSFYNDLFRSFSVFVGNRSNPRIIF